MSVAFTDPWVAGAESFGLSGWNEVVRGVMERRLAAGRYAFKWTNSGEWYGAGPIATADECLLVGGEDVSWAAFVRTLQFLLAYQYPPGLDDPGYYTIIADNAANTAWADKDTDAILTWTSLWAKVGQAEWRRAREWDPPADPVWLTHGRAAAGDILGPWIVEDFQRVLSQLVQRWPGYPSGSPTVYDFTNA